MCVAAHPAHVQDALGWLLQRFAFKEHVWCALWQPLNYCCDVVTPMRAADGGCIGQAACLCRALGLCAP